MGIETLAPTMGYVERSKGMNVYKFGGASVKDAEGIRNLVSILRESGDRPLVVVLSAMGKTTNGLEEVHRAYMEGRTDRFDRLEAIRQEHEQVVRELFKGRNHPAIDLVLSVFDDTVRKLQEVPAEDGDFEYDRIVSMGELAAVRLVTSYLKESGIPAKLGDARELIRTDRSYRKASIDWERSGELVAERMRPDLEERPQQVLVTQGFVGHTREGFPTTLGREGSDFSAAILAYLLDASALTIWKDVPGILNADPSRFPNPEKLDRISYREAIELSYNGAKVIHPRTIQPLENKGIPLFVKSFLHPHEPGTIIQRDAAMEPLKPVYIVRPDQVLISITPRDLSFIVEANLRDIFDRFARARIPVNMMQHSAINFSVVVDANEGIQKLLDGLEASFEVRYNTGLELLTIRHYRDKDLGERPLGKTVYLEQRTRHTARFLLG